MTLQNRVTPFGEIVAVAARGTLMGNRGCLHDAERRVVKTSARVAWVTCRLECDGIRRQLMTPKDARSFSSWMKPRRSRRVTGRAANVGRSAWWSSSGRGLAGLCSQGAAPDVHRRGNR